MDALSLSEEMDNDILEGFGALSLSGNANKSVEKPLPDVPPQGDRVNPVSKPVDGDNDRGSGSKSKLQRFVGGLNPRLLLNAKRDEFRRPLLESPSPNGRVVSMPLPVTMPSPRRESLSRTMQHALQMMDTSGKPEATPEPPLTPPVAPFRTNRSISGSSNAPPSRPKPNSHASSPAKSPPSISASGGLSRTANPATPSRARAQSISASTTPSPSKAVQCDAIAKSTGKRCLRTIKPPLTHAGMVPRPAVYCNMHLPKVHAELGFYINGRGDLVEFEKYVPRYLQLGTQQALKAEMAKAPSTADVPGYIYAFEVLDLSGDKRHLIQLKVGRAVNLQKRLDQWNKQCASKDHIPRGWWPDTLDSDPEIANGGLLRDHIITGEPGPLCHRVERLVHLELADLSLYAPYLEPGWPKAVSFNQSSSTASSTLSSIKRTADHWCADCGTRHVEIFSFLRPENEKYKGKEWELIVKPVIEKWGRFVKEHYS